MPESEDSCRRKHYQTGDNLAATQVSLRKRGRGLERVRRRKELSNLWDVVSRTREELETLANRPVLDSLSASWRVLDDFYGGLIERADKHHVASTPFEALFFYLEMGFYPPPELLLALSSMWAMYLRGGGKLSLEEVFLGRAVKKGGNFAQRRHTWAKYIHMGVQLEVLEEEGYSTIEAAEIVSERFGGKPEPESIVRLVRANYPLRKRRKKKRLVNPSIAK